MFEPEILPPEQAKAIFAGILLDFAENDTDNPGKHLEHPGFDVGATTASEELLWGLKVLATQD